MTVGLVGQAIARASEKEDLGEWEDSLAALDDAEWYLMKAGDRIGAALATNGDITSGRVSGPTQSLVGVQVYVTPNGLGGGW